MQITFEDGRKSSLTSTLAVQDIVPAASKQMAA
jgi:hypothetical protein